MFDRLKKDIKVVMTRDPAAKSALEVLICYPGLHAILFHRLAHFFYVKKLYFIARLLSQVSRFITGIEIHPGAEIGDGLFIDHGSGVVIGETTKIGHNVTIYQGVTLGGTGKEKGKRHPTIGNNVVIATGAKILGSFTVGDNSRIGAGSVVLGPVPPNSTVVGVPGKVVARDGVKLGAMDESAIDLRHDQLPDPVSEMINSLMSSVEKMEKRIKELEEKAGKKNEADAGSLERG